MVSALFYLIKKKEGKENEEKEFSEFVAAAIAL